MNRDDEDSTKKPKPTLDAPPPPPPGVVDVNNAVDPAYAYDDVEKLNQILMDNFDDTSVSKAPSDFAENNSTYDDAEWHYGGDFPNDVPESYAFTHIGFYLTWVAEQEQLSDFIREETAQLVASTLKRNVSPIALLEAWDGHLVDDMLNGEGNRFAAEYYVSEKKTGGYFADYFAEFSEYGAYEVPPTWENYDRIEPVISNRYEEWRAGRKEP